MGRAKPFDRGVEGNHGGGHAFPNRVGIEAAMDIITPTDKQREPTGIRPGSGCGYAETSWVKRVATDGVDGGFAQDDRCCAGSVNEEAAKVFAGTGCHAAPVSGCGATNLGADGQVFFSKEQKNSVAAMVSIETAGFDEGFDQGCSDSALMNEVVLYGREPVESFWRQHQG